MKKRVAQAMGCLLVMTMMAGSLTAWGKDGDKNRGKSRQKRK